MRTKSTNVFQRKNAHAGLHRLFLSELAIMYHSEKQLVLALPVIAKAAKSDDLKTLLEAHLKETKGHVDCIEQIAARLDELPDKKSEAMTGLIKDAVALVAREILSAHRDDAIIAAAQTIEHYEIASYGTLCAWARRLGYTHEMALLTSTLEQEKLASTLLMAVGKGTVPLPELVKKVSLKKVKGETPKRRPVRSGN